MPRSVAFIRNVMVGRRGLTRAVLLRVFHDAGAGEAVSHLATGNVSFAYDGSVVDLRTRVEQGIAGVIGQHEPVFIRTITGLRREMGRQPFAAPPFADVFERCVTFTDVAAPQLALPMTTPRGDAVVFAVRGSSVFSVTRRLDGRPGNPVRMIERVLGRRVTTRNWNTIEHIVRKHDSI